MKDLLRQARDYKNKKGSKYFFQTSYKLRDKVFDILFRKFGTNIIYVELQQPNANFLENTYLIDEKNINEYDRIEVDRPIIQGEISYPCVGFLVEDRGVDGNSLSSNLFNNAKKFLYNTGIIKFHNIILPKFSDQVLPYSVKKTSRIAIVTDYFFGNGDAITVSDQIQKFIDINNKKGIEVEIITKPKTERILSFLLNKCRIFSSIESNDIYYSVLISNYYQNVYLTPFLLSEPPLLHLSELYAKSFNLEQVASQNKRLPLPPLDSPIQKVLDSKLGKKIGLQFFTKDNKRNWDENNVRNFIKLCQERDYKVFILTPSPLTFGNTVDVSYLQLTELFSVINQLDIVVSIDSVCGHIAGKLKIPNITIWGRNYPTLTNPLKGNDGFVSFRPLSMNYSIVPLSTKTVDVSANLVFNRVEKITNKEIKLKNDRITSLDSLTNHNIEWVNSNDV